MERLCGRPSNFEDIICAEWQNRVGYRDSVIHLGDFSFRYNDAEAHIKWLHTLPGKKILVRGNHDKKSTNWYIEHGWDFVCDEFVMVFEGKRLKFQHKPSKTESDSYDYHAVISGHQHQNYNPEECLENQYVVSLELQGYSPQLLTQVLKSVSKRAILK